MVVLTVDWKVGWRVYLMVDSWVARQVFELAAQTVGSMVGL